MTFNKDLVERMAWTFVQAALAVLVVTDVSTFKTAAAAGAAAVLSAVKTLARQQLDA